MKKKKWSTPLLTVVVRGKPEEKLLIKCSNAETPGFMSSDIGVCYKDALDPIWCDFCMSWTIS